MRYFVPVFLIILSAVAPASRAEGEINLTAGFTLPAEEVTGRFGENWNPDPTYGLRGGVEITPRIAWFADLVLTSLETAAIMEEGNALTFRTGVDFKLNPEVPEQWFVSVGAGYGEIKYGRSFYDFDYTFASVGFGQMYELQKDRRLRLEFRADINPAGAGPIDEWFLNFHTLVSFGWSFDRSRSRDRDQDGVPSNLDRCPDTDADWPVDRHGCPLDSDGDGVSDGRDECPVTHPKAKVDGEGCALDSDGDNVADGLDKCPDTPKGALVGLWGCPLDTDRDGVYDGIDRCPGTAAGTGVDETGCPY